jgi:hypothetical protein
MEHTHPTERSDAVDEAQQTLESVNPKSRRPGFPPPKYPIEYWKERLIGKKLYRDDKEISPEENNVIFHNLSPGINSFKQANFFFLSQTAVRQIDIPVPTRKLPGSIDFIRVPERYIVMAAND